jgi:hypothetical protein
VIQLDMDNAGNKNIIRNLRFQYGESLSKFTDEQILATFNDYNLSDKSEDFMVWMSDVEAA